MERLEFIAEARKKGYEDSDTQEWLELYDKSVQEGKPLALESFFDFFDLFDVHTACARVSIPALLA